MISAAQRHGLRTVVRVQTQVACDISLHGEVRQRTHADRQPGHGSEFMLMQMLECEGERRQKKIIIKEEKENKRANKDNELKRCTSERARELGIYC